METWHFYAFFGCPNYIISSPSPPVVAQMNHVQTSAGFQTKCDEIDLNHIGVASAIWKMRSIFIFFLREILKTNDLWNDFDTSQMFFAQFQ